MYTKSNPGRLREGIRRDRRAVARLLARAAIRRAVAHGRPAAAPHLRCARRTAGGANNTSSSSGLSEAEAQKLRANESAALEMHKVAAEHAASLQAQLDELKARVAQQPVEAEEGGRAKRPRTSQ